ncbi:hypothetical protein H6P81_004250 [Aristolochia fimbriata]|uniref:Endonuclease/exonuclease/phosphatase domain-containing protein n=1 Tax=Aristolochia fimbriata TaxID=158543 RepID=A0AAV7FEW1_ARIFI|nr:hypothetical protein H6P81_004250 [Aristolochia fimbriata]
MRVVSPYVQSLVSATSDASTMSSRFPYRGRYSFRRGFSDRSRDGEEVFVTGDSHYNNVRDTNYGFRVGQRGGYSDSRGYPSQSSRSWGPLRPPFRPPPRPDDFRSWVFSPSQAPPHWERFVVLSYNILADYLARDHRHRLYFHIPPYILDWEWRRRRIMVELGLWAPDIMCFQEVDKFEDLEIDLNPQGYSGIWKMRTGAPLDGCAIFWRTSRFSLLQEETIEFKSYGLRDNVAQICVLESRSKISHGNGSTGSLIQPESYCHSRGSNKVVICNTHVLYNPNRGDIKLGQVRILLDRAHAIARTWNDAPVVICGDFNATPKSPLYNFISEQKLSLCGLAKNEVSGQSSPCINAPRTTMPLPEVVSPPSNPLKAHVTVGGETNNINQNYSPAQMSAHRRSQCQREEPSLQESSWSSQLKSEGLFDLVSEDTSSDGSEFIFAEHTDKVSDQLVEEKTFDQTLFVSAQEGQLRNEFAPADPESDQLDALVDKVGELVFEELCLAEDHTAHSSRKESPVCSAENASTCEVNCKNDKSVLEDTKCSTFIKLDTELENDDIKSCSLDVDPCAGRPNDLCNTNETNGPGYGEHSHKRETLSQHNNLIVGKKGKVNLYRSGESSFVAEDDSMLPADTEAFFMEKMTYDPHLWTPEELTAASGNADCNYIEHSLKLKSAYTEAKDFAGTRDASGEPQVTSYNRKFMGTVDYIWFSEGLQTLKVLDTIPKHVLQRTPGFPTRKWGSDHLALACELAFKDLPMENLHNFKSGVSNQTYFGTETIYLNLISWAEKEEVRKNDESDSKRKQKMQKVTRKLVRQQRMPENKTKRGTTAKLEPGSFLVCRIETQGLSKSPEGGCSKRSSVGITSCE